MGLKLETRSAEWIAAHDQHVVCPYCYAVMVLKNTPYGIGYVCEICGVRHGAHQKTGEPLGTPAGDKETRQARVDAHDALDSLWRGIEAKLTRNNAYAYLAAAMGLSSEECHIGRFDHGQCCRAIKICEEFE